jgi:hypothetical protein
MPWGKGFSGYAQYPQPSLALAPYQVNPQLEAPNSFKDLWKKLNESQIAPTPVQNAVVGLRHNAESGIVGALLALIDTDLGGLDLGGKVPIDLLGAAVFYVLSVQDSENPNGLSSDYRAVSQSCSTVAAFRAVHRWREASKGIPQNTPQLSGDPVIAAARTSTF